MTELRLNAYHIMWLFVFFDLPVTTKKEMKAASAKLAETVATAATLEGKAQAEYFRDTVKVAMDELRAPVDKAEMIVDKEFWPFPSYSELLFEV